MIISDGVITQYMLPISLDRYLMHSSGSWKEKHFRYSLSCILSVLSVKPSEKFTLDKSKLNM